jgi:hypothetical protein
LERRLLIECTAASDDSFAKGRSDFWRAKGQKMRAIFWAISTTVS